MTSLHTEVLHVVVQSPSHVWISVTLWTAKHASLSLTISRSLPKFMSIASMMPSSQLILWSPLLLLSSIFPSIRDFPNESAVHIKWLKYWSFSFSISPSNDYSGLISLEIDWFDLLAIHGTLRSLLQPHSLKTSILWCSVFFTVQLSQLHMTIEKTIDMTIQTFVYRVTSLLFHTLSRFAIAFLPRSNHLISWLQSPFAVILESKKRKSVTSSSFSLSVCHEIMVARCHDLSFLVFNFKLALSLSSFTLIKGLFSSSLVSVIRVVSSTYLKHLLMFLPPV